MSMSRREKDRKQIKYQDSKKVLENQEKGGFSWTSLRVSDDIRKRQFRFGKEKTYRLALIPYIAGEGNLDCGEGFATYICRYFVHPNVGPSEQLIVCSNSTFKQACYGCEDLKRQWKQHGFNKDQSKRSGAKQRALFNVLDLDEPEKGVQWFETAHYMMFGELLYNKLAADAARPEGGIYQEFWHLDEGGFTIEVKIEEKNNPVQAGKFFKPVNIEFVPRKKALPDDLVYEAVCLDEMIWGRSYEEFKNLWNGNNGEGKEEDDSCEKSIDDESSKKLNLTANDLELSVGDIVNYVDEEGDVFQECEIKKISNDGKSLVLEDQEGAMHKGVASHEVDKVEVKDDDEEEDEQEEDSLSNGSSRKKKKEAVASAVNSKSSSFDDDLFDSGEDKEEEEDEEDDTPVPLSKKGK